MAGIHKLPTNWDDLIYLAMYPDVKNAVEKGHLESGYAHYLKNGIKEGRQPAWKKKYQR